jgi:hypothetical protein
MKLPKAIFWILLLGFVSWGLWYFVFPPPEKVIRQRLSKLAAAISEQPQGNISKIANVSHIGSFFHPNVSLNVEGFQRDVSSISGRGELEQMALGARQNGVAVHVEFSNLHIQAVRGETNASALITAEVVLNEQKEPIVQDLRVNFEKLDRKWLIRSVEPTKGFKVQ